MLYAAVLPKPQHIVHFSAAVLHAAFKIGHLLLSLMLGVKTAAYYDQKTQQMMFFLLVLTYLKPTL